MNTVLVVGPFDSTGYGVASTNLALALDRAGANVTCRRFHLDKRPYEAPKRVQELLAKTGGSPPDVCLQVMLPHQMRSYRDLPTVGYFFWETSHFRSSSWASHLNRLQGLIVPAQNTHDACVASGVSTRISLVPTPSDVSRYERAYEPLKAIRSLRQDSFLFYTISEFNERKDIKSLLTAYYTEFTRSENVHFVLKVDKPGVSPEDFQQQFAAWNNELLKSLKLHHDPERYPSVTIVPTRLSDEEVLRLHASCDVFVQASKGEGWSYCGYDAMCLGRTPIVPAHSGYLAWADDKVGWTYPAMREGCSGVTDSFADLYRADEDWFRADVAALRRCMREAFQNPASRLDKSRRGLERAYSFSYEVIGPQLLEVLAACAKRTPSGWTSGTST